MNDLIGKKTSELLDMFMDDMDDLAYDRLMEELRTRFPFDYILDAIESNKENIDNMDRDFSGHVHVDSKVYFKK